MQNINDDLLKQAEDLEKQSKNEIKNKNYSTAISLLLNAKDIYTRLGLTGQVGILLKEIVRLKNLEKEEVKPVFLKKEEKKPIFPKKEETKSISPTIDITPPKDTKIKMEINGKDVLESKGNQLLEEARYLALNKELNESIKIYNEAYDIFKKINHTYECKQILWQINEIKEYQKWGKSRKAEGIQVPVKDIISLAAAEKRRLWIQKRLKEGNRARSAQSDESKPKTKEKKEIKSYKLFEQRTRKEKLEAEKRTAELKLLKEQQEQRKQIIGEREEKIRKLHEQKQTEDKLQKIAEDFLDKAKKFVQRREYDEAKLNYEKAIEIFTGLGWSSQVKVLKQELWNVDRYKKEYEKKLESYALSRQKNEEKFQKRVKTMKSDYIKYQERVVEKMGDLPSEIKAKLEKANLLKEKAAKEESLNKLGRVLERYKYILKLYLSIPKETVDLTEEVSYIKQKISQLENNI
ncbi:MAG: hypothetical protein ACFE8M_03205 [Candidatus Hermodarchaeota archaeon]